MWTRSLLVATAVVILLAYWKREHDRYLAFLEMRGCIYEYERTVITENAAIHQIVLRCRDGQEVIL